MLCCSDVVYGVVVVVMVVVDVDIDVVAVMCVMSCDVGMYGIMVYGCHA